MTALPDISGVPHPPTWLLYPHRWLGRFVLRRRFAVREHGTANVPAEGAVIVAANHTGAADGLLLALFGPRPVHVLTEQERFMGRRGTLLRLAGQIRLDRFHADPGAVKTCLRVLADGHAVGVFPEGSSHRGAAYLALVSGAPVVPLTILGTTGERRADLVYGAPYRTAARSWPRTKKQVDATALDLHVHTLVAVDAARTLTSLTPGGTR